MRAVPIGLGVGNEPRIRLVAQRSDYEGFSPFRRGQSVRRSRQGLLKKRLQQLAAALVVITAPTALVAWLMSSPRFAVRELAVVTGERVPEVWVRQTLAPMVGENLPRLPLARAESALRGHPWVRGADLRKDLPARLAVRVAERRAVALLRTSDRLHYVDSAGGRIAPCDPTVERAVDLPLISVTDRGLSLARARQASPLREAVPAVGPSGVGSGETASLRAAVQLMAEIEEVVPAWAAGLSEIEVFGERDFRVHTSALPFPVQVTSGTLNQRVRRLEELLPHLVARFGAGATVDLRFARRIIVKPSVEPADRRARSGPSWSGLPRRGQFRPIPPTEHQEATTNHAQRG